MGERFLRPTKEAEVRGHETPQVESGRAPSTVGGNAPPSPAPTSPVLPPPFRGVGELQAVGELLDDLQQQVDAVGDDAVYAYFYQLLHLVRVVDGPDVNL